MAPTNLVFSGEPQTHKPLDICWNTDLNTIFRLPYSVISFYRICEKFSVNITLTILKYEILGEYDLEISLITYQ